MAPSLGDFLARLSEQLEEGLRRQRHRKKELQLARALRTLEDALLFLQLRAELQEAGRAELTIRIRAGFDLLEAIPHRIDASSLEACESALAQVQALHAHIGDVAKDMPAGDPAAETNPGKTRLRYFEDVLREEFVRINTRRSAQPDPQQRRTPVRQAASSLNTPGGVKEHARSCRKVFGDSFETGTRPATRADLPWIDPDQPDPDKTRPLPMPCDARGLAFSGGGVRSAAVCLGALQALESQKLIESFDYLSTVSGGGYIGAGLSAAMSSHGGRRFPYGADVADNAAIAHLRNYSNYLLPRGRSGIRNVADAGVIVLRGLIANVVVVSSVILGFVLLTLIAYPEVDTLHAGSFLPRLVDSACPARHFETLCAGLSLNHWLGAAPMRLTLIMLVVLGALLIVWAGLRSWARFDGIAGDTDGQILQWARGLLIATAIVGLLDLQPIAVAFYIEHKSAWFEWVDFKVLISALVAFSGAVSSLSSTLGRFLKTSQRATDWATIARRVATHGIVFLAAMALPVALWVAYLAMVASGLDWTTTVPATLAWLIPVVRQVFDFAWPWFPSIKAQIYLPIFVAAFAVSLFFKANGYSLHRLYRDRLSHAFQFKFTGSGAASKLELLDSLKLSQTDSTGPYHIINAAMNVQGSKEANKRGRNADFFMFTRDFIGSDLTMYAPTRERTFRATTSMEEDRRLDLATAMAISGAAVSANMGTNTIRLLSPTLALLNIRLGYWLRNPRAFARSPGDGVKRLFNKFYLLMEMLNQLDETNRYIYLSDGGHIENLGAYELLKRGCELIVVVDAEADPDMAFPSLLKLERYARIDLGVRIVLPWQDIATAARAVDAEVAQGFAKRRRGPHCAVGRIVYGNGAQGVMVYFKSSLSGDEKDYVLDYKRRFAAFPHETTGDQFFSEEQFECYRALGFHMVSGFFGGWDAFSYLSEGPEAFADSADAMRAVAASLPGVQPALKTLAARLQRRAEEAAL